MVRHQRISRIQMPHQQKRNDSMPIGIIGAESLNQDSGRWPSKYRGLHIRAAAARTTVKIHRISICRSMFQRLHHTQLRLALIMALMLDGNSIFHTKVRCFTIFHFDKANVSYFLLHLQSTRPIRHWCEKSNYSKSTSRPTNCCTDCNKYVGVSGCRWNCNGYPTMKNSKNAGHRFRPI